MSLALDVLQIENGVITEITTFALEDRVELFGLAKVL